MTDKELKGLVASLAVAQGIGVARMHGDIFRLKVPANFQPKDFAPQAA